MKLKLMDYSDKLFEYEIGDLNTIDSIQIDVISGDEVGDVIYKDGSYKIFDTANSDRLEDFFDGSYVVYDINDDINLLNDLEWVNRKTSYSFLWNINE